MGINDRETEKRDTRRQKQKAARSRRRSNAGTFDVRLVDHAALVACYIVAAEASGAVRIGLTRDGGGFAIGCYAGDEYATEYVKPAEVFADAVREIVEAWWPDGLDTYDALYQALTQGRPLQARSDE